jgi:hypothetical protein
MKLTEITALPFSSLLLHSSSHFLIAPLYTELYLIAHSFFTFNHFFTLFHILWHRASQFMEQKASVNLKGTDLNVLFVPSLCAYCCSDYKDVISIILFNKACLKPRQCFITH